MSGSDPHFGEEHREPRSLNLLFALTVFATLAPVVNALWAASPTRASLVALAGVAHVVCALRVFDLTRAVRRHRVVYFAVQGLLIGTVLVASRCFGSAPIAAMPILVQAGMVLSARAAWSCAAAPLLLIAIVELQNGVSLQTVLTLIIPGYGAAVLFSVLFARVLRNEREARAEVVQLQAELQDRAAERERLRIARDIHDGLGHTLTVIATRLEAARHLAIEDPQRTAALLDQTTGMVRDGLAEVRRSVAQMRDDAGAPEDLHAAVRDLAAQASSQDFSVRVAAGPAGAPLDAPARLVLWRAAQEGVTNAHRHSGGSRCELAFDRTDSGGIALTVDDDGRGPVPASDDDASRHFGLSGLRERAHELGGSLTTGGSPLGGFRLTLSLPAHR